MRGARGSFLAQAMTVATKDLTAEARSKAILNSAVPFAIVLLLSFGLAFGPDRTILQRTAPALVWVAVLLAGLLAVRRSFEIENEDGALEGLAISPADPAAIYLGKLVALTAQLLALELVTLVAVAFFFGVEVSAHFGVLMAGAFLGTVGFAAVGTVFGLMSARSSGPEALLPLLILPLVIPILIAGTRSIELALAGGMPGAAQWLGLLAAFGAIFTSSGAIVFEHLLED